MSQKRDGKGDIMIWLKITRTGKGYSPKDEWQRFDSENKYFRSLKEAKDYLKERYGNCKRVKMYCDPYNKHIGYIYSFRADDGRKFIEQDWVEFREFQTITPVRAA